MMLSIDWLPIVSMSPFLLLTIAAEGTLIFLAQNKGQLVLPQCR